MSINVRAMANARTQVVNSNQTISLQRSTGYTTSPNGTQVPTFTTLSGEAQIQALGPEDLKYMNSLNIQGVKRKVYLYGNWMGVVRTDSKGGDVLSFPQIPGGTAQQWKAVTIFETWDSWSAIGVVLQ